MRFEFATATRVVFGAGMVRSVAPAAKEMGRRVLVVAGRTGERASGLIGELKAAGLACALFHVAGEPTVDVVREGVRAAREGQAEVVIGFGGGSAIDAGKAIAGLMTNSGEPLDYLEVIGQGKNLELPAAPFIAVPTTAGTGSEVTRNAVLGSPEHRVKASLRSPFLLPRLAVVDPELTSELPEAITATTGLDALTQLIEPYVSSRANPMTDGICEEGMRRAGGALVRAFLDPGDKEARRDMALASLMGGLALANAGLGVVHGFAAPVGGMFAAPHGAVCAALLPHGMAANLRALRARVPESEALGRYQEAARILTGRGDATAEDGVTWARETCRKLRIVPLGAYGIGAEHVPVLVERASQASSMKANPIALAADELWETLSAAL